MSVASTLRLADGTRPVLSPLRAGDFPEQGKESLFSRARYLPVHRQRLKSVLVFFTRLPVVEISPGGAFFDGGDHVVVGLVEIVVIILVEDDRLAPIRGRRAVAHDQQADAVGVMRSI